MKTKKINSLLATRVHCSIDQGITRTLSGAWWQHDIPQFRELHNFRLESKTKKHGQHKPFRTTISLIMMLERLAERPN